MIALNNIFNIRKVKQYNWQGAVGETKGFVAFENDTFAIRAMCILLMRSYRIAGANTINKIVHRFAPPIENNTESYVRFVSRFTGYDPDRILKTKIEYADVICAMAKMETGWQLKRNQVLDVMFCYNLKVWNRK